MNYTLRWYRVGSPSEAPMPEEPLTFTAASSDDARAAAQAELLKIATRIRSINFASERELIGYVEGAAKC